MKKKTKKEVCRSNYIKVKKLKYTYILIIQRKGNEDSNHTQKHYQNTTATVLLAYPHNSHRHCPLYQV
jgi:hypothetical protein